MRLVTGVITLLLASTGAWAQGLTGQISGTIQDPQGAAVVDAEVVLTNQGTTQARQTKTDTSGAYLFTQLLPGTYTVTVTAAGFKKLEKKDIVLTATERVVMPPAVLTLGDVSQTVSIEAEGARVQTQSAERSGLISTQQMQDLSLKGRDYLGFVKLLPGVLDTSNREAPGWNNLGGITINGNRAGTINLTLDGVSSLDTGSMGGPYLAPSADAVAEIKVLLTNYQAEYGRSSGGTINTVIKSGTKEFHGGAYYFLRNEALNANEYFRNLGGLPRPRYRFNYPGYFLGGPVLLPGGYNKNRDKLFFFWSQEFLPRNRPTNLVRRTFPTALERDGNFSRTVDQNGTQIPIWDPLNNRVPFPGNIVPGSRIDPQGQAMLRFFPVGGDWLDSSRTFNSLIQSTVNQPRRDSILRIDWNINSKNIFYWRGINDYEAFKGQFDFVLASASWPQLPISYQIRSAGSVATLISTINPTTVNEFTFGVNRAKQTVDPLTAEGLTRNQRGAGSGITLRQFFPQANPFNLIPNANFGGVPNAGVLNIEQRFPFFGTNNIWNWSDNLSKIAGKHNLKAGIYVERTTRNARRSTAFNGTFNFNRDVNNPLDSNYAYSNAILGSIQSYTESDLQPSAHARYVNVEWFVQDAWKVTKRFTIDAGIRFYYIQPTWSEGDKLAVFNEGLYSAAQQPPLIQPFRNDANVRVGRDPVTGELLPVATIGTFSRARGTPYQGQEVFNERVQFTPGIQYAPRLGFAWDVFGNAKTAVRGGVGIFYDRYNDDQILQLVEAPPNVNTPSAFYTSIRDLVATPLRLSPAGVFGLQRSFNPPTVYNWSFGVQQNIGKGIVADVAYVGNQGRYLLQRRSLNGVRYGTRFRPSSIDPTTNTPLPDNFLRPFAGFGDIQYLEFASNSNYHSLQTQLNKRFAKGLTFGVAWTWSKAMNFVNGNNDAVNPFLDFRMRNYGRANIDRTHNFVANFIYDVPKASKLVNNWATRGILDNWQISGIISAISGPPSGVGYSLVSGRDIVGGSGAGVDSRVDLIADPRPKTNGRAFNIDSVASPNRDLFGIGNAPKDIYRGPGLHTWDVSFFKNIPFSEDAARRLQLRFEFYNFFNHTNFSAVDNGARFDEAGRQVNLNLGTYTASLDARRIVLGAKFYF